jgi:hypothetical protein
MVKIRKYFSIVALFLSPLVAKTQESDAMLSIFQKSNFTALQNLMAEIVDLSIEENQDFENKAKALSKLKDFFNSNPILSIESVHNGSSKKLSNDYIVYKFISSSNKPYRMIIYKEKLNSKKLISEIRIEAMNTD